ncbi:MAG: magnesium transporter [bacterium]
MESRINTIKRQLIEHLRQENERGLQNLFEVTHPGDFAAVLEVVDLDDAKELFSRLPASRRTEILDEVAPRRSVELLSELSEEAVVDVLEDMPPDDAADIFLMFDDEAQEEYLSKIDDDQYRRTIIDLISYPADSAGGIMTTEYLAVSEKLSVEEAIQTVRRRSEDAEILYYLYTLDEDNRLSGVIAMRELLQAEPTQQLRDLASRDLVHARIDDDQEEAAQLLDRYNLLAVPVLDHQDHMRGIITVDDAVGILEQEATEDIYKQAGISPYQELEAERSIRLTQSSFWTNMSLRIPWLTVVFIGTLLTASSVSLFEGYLNKFVELAFFMPVIAAMGGNVGAQSTTIFVRALTLGQIDTGDFWRPFLAEMYKTGMGIGLFFGLFLGLTSWGWQVYLRGTDPVGYALSFGLAVGMAMFFAILAASANGFFIPWLVSVMGADPAAASNPLLTTVQDLVGIFIYFGCASLFLTVLG